MDSHVLDVLADRVLELGPKPDDAGPWRNFKLTRDADGVAWLLFDRAGSSANTLSADVIEELDAVLAALESQRPTGLVIRSAKASGFIAGADVNEFRGATDPRMVETAMSRAHAVADRLDALKFPTVAVIHGFCLGGGLEVALACQITDRDRRRPLRLSRRCCSACIRASAAPRASRIWSTRRRR